MTESKYYSDFTSEELDKGLLSMSEEIYECPVWIRNLFWMAWDDFAVNKWSYDGATFSKERFEDTLFEVAAFIHDWMNSNGIVSYSVDAIMLKIMKDLKYTRKERFLRWFKTRFTFLNILRHKYFLKTYKGKYAIELVLKR